MKRAYVFTSKKEEYGKLLAVNDSTENFIDHISDKFNISKENIRLFTENDCEIHDSLLIRDNEKVYLSTDDKKKLNSSLQDPYKKCETNQDVGDEWITLNVGGKQFTTSKSTLTTKEPMSMLARMFSDDNRSFCNPSAKDNNGAYLIDRSPVYFEPILNYLRHGVVVLDKNINPQGVLEEAAFYGFESMIVELKNLLSKYESTTSTDNRPLTRMDIVQSLITTPINSELRFQGVNLAGADLTRLDLRNINFKYACLSRCNLSGANLSHCCLERADLSHAHLEGTQLLGVKALCANMEGANLKGCNMEDPVGSSAVLEGVNLKGANLEGSNMAGVNLRVATLKNANLQNCDLRAAVLAGADLEYCDLSGSDLHEANLRGANLKDAAFELMLTPLHMSQTIR